MHEGYYFPFIDIRRLLPKVQIFPLKGNTFLIVQYYYIIINIKSISFKLNIPLNQHIFLFYIYNSWNRHILIFIDCLSPFIFSPFLSIFFLVYKSTGKIFSPLSSFWQFSPILFFVNNKDSNGSIRCLIQFNFNVDSLLPLPITTLFWFISKKLWFNRL